MATDVAKPAVRPTTYAKFELITRLYLQRGQAALARIHKIV